MYLGRHYNTARYLTFQNPHRTSIISLKYSKTALTFPYEFCVLTFCTGTRLKFQKCLCWFVGLQNQDSMVAKNSDNDLAC